MRAVRVTSHDGPSAVTVEDVPEPQPGDGEVLVDVEAAGVNFPDLLLTQDRYQYKPELPFTLGGEPAGTVRWAPPDSGLAVGQRVAAASTVGAFAETVAVRADAVFPLPDGVTSAAGACLPMNYLTMSFGLGIRGGLQAGETVLVHGAAGGIGTASVQLALALGAHVIAVTSTDEKATFVRSLGVDTVVGSEGFKDAVLEATGGAGVDLVVDPVGGDRFTDSLRCLAPLGRLLVVGFTAGDIPTVKVNRLLLNNIDVRGVGWGAYALPRPGAQRREWDRIVPLLESGALTPPIGGTYPLDRAGEAVAALGGRSALGKLVVAVR
ncbi:NADPH:quinone oxidoreductase family protein [Actinomycetospora chiangmaiensis]|uniref:NADPH:quinone oxidoreductase family protein n=1 Tax=Actinomycetospora chiangmaiensis TaxID=402650 RepID=UPI0003AA2D1B|nr:NADPH:quinone oxidoreductase family protein [Actinomycetospora chiangmaiensis]